MTLLNKKKSKNDFKNKLMAFLLPKNIVVKNYLVFFI